MSHTRFRVNLGVTLWLPESQGKSKSRDTLILWLSDKSKLFYLDF